MRPFIFLCCLFYAAALKAQVNYGTPNERDLPPKLKGIPNTIEVMHFPQVNHPVKVKELYYWKHATALMCNSNEITITEFGAYIYYNDQWNLRKSYDLKDLDKLFGTKNQVMLQGQPYVWSKNWRVSDQLFGGWALWYFLGTDSNGQTICGYAKIHTTDNLLNN